MKKLYLHIGLSKTGSSALQSWLSLNTEKLSYQGFYYADLVPSAKKGKITAGNGVALFNACKAENFYEIERLIKNVYFASHEKAIISSETLQNIPPESIAKIKEICDENSISVVVIAYIRSAYELFYSNYLQGIKRHGFSFKFGDKGNFSYAMQVKFLNNYLQVFKESLIVKNYDLDKKDIFKSFANIIKFDSCDTKIENKTVNRSLTNNEAEVLREANSIHKGEFSTEISDYLIGRLPDKKTSVFYRKDLIEKVKKNCCDDIEWINSHFFKDEECLFPCYENESLPLTNQKFDHKDDIYKIIVEWCLTSDKKNQGDEYITFIRDFAVTIEKSNLDLAYKLMCKALSLRPNGPFIKNRIAIYKKIMNIS